ncbi:MAG: thioredoxin [Clostridia bacterium]|nr:thioredoxin [Clostridia bacterium]
MAEVTVTKANFQKEVLESAIPVLVDFWASWCGPCRMLAPAVSAVAEERAGSVKVGKVNVDEEPELAQAYGIAGIPALLLFKGGKVAGNIVGLRPKQSIDEFLDDNI